MERLKKMASFDTPSPSTVREDLSSYPLEALREELNNVNKGLDELMRRRREVTTAINDKIEDSRNHLMSSDEFFAKVTGQYEGDSPVKFAGPEDEVPREYRRY